MEYRKTHFGFEYRNWNVEFNTDNTGFCQNFVSDREYWFHLEPSGIVFRNKDQSIATDVPQYLIKKIETNGKLFWSWAVVDTSVEEEA